MKNSIGKLIASGIDQNLDETLAQKVRLTNILSLTVITFASFFVYIFWTLKLYWGTVFLVISIPLFFGILFVNKKKLYVLSRILFLLFANIYLVVYGLFFGKETGMALLFVVFGSMPFLIFTLKDKMYIIVAILVSAFCYFSIEIPLVEPRANLPQESAKTLYYLMFSLTFLWMVINFIYLTIQTNDYIKKIRSQNQSINQSLAEKEVLLKEVHHRVKNNLQIIISLLSLQAREAQFQGCSVVFDESVRRIKAIASVHELLYQSKDLSHILFSNYIERLIDDLLRTAAHSGIDVKKTINLEQAYFEVDTAVPLGLVINELVTNSIKYGVKDKMLSVHTKLTKDEAGDYLLEYKDEGFGVNNEEVRNQKSLGNILIKSLVAQIGGEMEKAQSENGFSVNIRFSVKENSEPNLSS